MARKKKIDFSGKLMNAGVRTTGLVAGSVAGGLVNNKFMPWIQSKVNFPAWVGDLALLTVGTVVSAVAESVPAVAAFGDGITAGAGHRVAGTVVPQLAGISGVGNPQSLLDIPEEGVVVLEGVVENTYNNTTMGGNGGFNDFVAGPGTHTDFVMMGVI